MKIRSMSGIILFAVVIFLSKINTAQAAAVDLVLQNVTPPSTALFLDQEITYTIRLSNTNAGTTATGYTINLPTSVRALRVTCTTTVTANCGSSSVSNNSVISTSSTILGNATTGTNRLNLTIFGRVTSLGTLDNVVTVVKGSVDTEADISDNIVNLADSTVGRQLAFSLCPSNGFYTRASGTDTVLSSVDIATGSKTVVGTTNFSYNAVGFNRNDGYLYGIRGGTNPTLVRIGINGNAQDLGRIDFNGFPTSTTGSAAEINVSNDMFMIANNSDRLYQISVDRLSANFAKVQNSVLLSGISTTGGAGAFNIGDLSINPVDFDA